jgi:hypothetical protein
MENGRRDVALALQTFVQGAAYVNMGSLLPLAAPSTNVRSGPIAIMIGRGMVIGYINATSTRECTFRTGFAAE